MGVAVLLPLTFFMKVKYNENMERIGDPFEKNGRKYTKIKYVPNVESFNPLLSSIIAAISDIYQDAQEQSQGHPGIVFALIYLRGVQKATRHPFLQSAVDHPDGSASGSDCLIQFDFQGTKTFCRHCPGSA